MGQRTGNSGFVLWDALIAFAIVAVAVTVIVVSLPQGSRRAADRIQRYEATEFAFSKLEEYRIAYPTLPVEGTEPSGWTWSIREQSLPDVNASVPVHLFNVEVTTWHANWPDLSATIQAVVARRAPQ